MKILKLIEKQNVNGLMLLFDKGESFSNCTITLPEIINESVHTSGSDEDKPKKKRGRPRKNVIPNVEIVEIQN